MPILGDIPGIGRLFSTTTESVNNTETVIIITPRIIQSGQAATDLTAEKAEQIDQEVTVIKAHQADLESTKVTTKLEANMK